MRIGAVARYPEMEEPLSGALRPLFMRRWSRLRVRPRDTGPRGPGSAALGTVSDAWNHEALHLPTSFILKTSPSLRWPLVTFYQVHVWHADQALVPIALNHPPSFRRPLGLRVSRRVPCAWIGIRSRRIRRSFFFTPSRGPGGEPGSSYGEGFPWPLTLPFAPARGSARHHGSSIR